MERLIKTTLAPMFPVDEHRLDPQDLRVGPDLEQSQGERNAHWLVVEGGHEVLGVGQLQHLPGRAGHLQRVSALGLGFQGQLHGELDQEGQEVFRGRDDAYAFHSIYRRLAESHGRGRPVTLSRVWAIPHSAEIPVSSGTFEFFCKELTIINLFNSRIIKKLR